MIENNNTDRHHAPKGREKNSLQWLLMGALAFALMGVAYLLLSSPANGVVGGERKPERKLHIANDNFQMPVFEKPKQKEPEPIIETLPLPEVFIEELPQPQPLTLIKPQKIDNTPVSVEILSDEDRRLTGTVSGTKGVPAISVSAVEKNNIETEETPSYSAPFYENRRIRAVKREASTDEVIATPLSISRASVDTSYQPNGLNTGDGQVGNGSGGIDLSSTVVPSTRAKKMDMEYLLKKGTYIHCVLKTRIVSDQAGFINCTITENIYSADGTRLLLPRGSDVLGEYKPKTLSTGKTRLHAVWDAVTTPSGIRVNLASPSVGRLGSAGLSGDINNHWGQKIGIPILLSLFKTSIEYNTRQYSGQSGAYYESSREHTDRAIDRQIGEYERIQPTLTKRHGETIGILVSRDVDFKAVLKSFQ